MEKDSSESIFSKHNNRKFLKGLARAFAGAILFAFALLMTMEMWQLGFAIEPLKLALFMFLAVPFLIGLSHYIGFEMTFEPLDDVVDAFVAYAVGFVTSAAMLFIFGVINFEMSWGEIIGKISIQAVIAAFGAVFAQSELGKSGDEENDEKEEKRKDETNYFGELFLMSVGALFLAMSPAATEEMVLISYKMSDLHIVGLMILTLVLTHAFVYSVGFRGQELYNDKSLLSIFVRFTVAGYAISLLVSLYLLWTFGLIDGMGAEEILRVTVVLGFPSALGAAASRLIL
jgi:putative integral membrane protein (TIGR02587 family)